MGGKYLINGKSYPATDAYKVKMGVPVRIRLVNVGEMGHPMHLHGFSFRQVAENGSPVAPKEQRRMFTQMVQPGETYEEEYTPDRPGAWLFHCHILSHVTDANGGDTGMITPIVAG